MRGGAQSTETMQRFERRLDHGHTEQ
jgi:hypothetical protein